MLFRLKKKIRFYIPEDDKKEYGIENLPSLKKFKKNHILIQFFIT